jgi:pimeloyl-ACP methyl ester carboxylesterase
VIHGQPSSSYSFRDVISPLAEVARLVAPDLPGFGFTQAPADYEFTFDAMALTVDATAQEIGLSWYFLYVHDFGAPVAYDLALAHPERVLGLIIQNGNAHERLPDRSDDLRRLLADARSVARPRISGLPHRELSDRVARWSQIWTHARVNVSRPRTLIRGPTPPPALRSSR